MNNEEQNLNESTESKTGVNTLLAEVKQTDSEEKTLTIKKVNMVGKWVEFWFEEEHPTITGEADAYQLSSKAYKLWDAVNKAELERPIMNNGFIGKKLKWKKEGFNWEIVEFV